METAVIVALIALAQGIGVAVINNAMKRRDASTAEYRSHREAKEKERDDAEREREERRNMRDDLFVGLLFAALDGDEVLLKIAQGEKADGNVDRAVAKIDLAKTKYNEFVNGVANRI